ETDGVELPVGRYLEDHFRVAHAVAVLREVVGDRNRRQAARAGANRLYHQVHEPGRLDAHPAQAVEAAEQVDDRLDVLHGRCLRGGGGGRAGPPAGYPCYWSTSSKRSAHSSRTVGSSAAMNASQT